jgi:hypothetical protein
MPADYWKEGVSVCVGWCGRPDATPSPMRISWHPIGSTLFGGRGAGRGSGAHRSTSITASAAGSWEQATGYRMGMLHMVCRARRMGAGAGRDARRGGCDAHYYPSPERSPPFAKDDLASTICHHMPPQRALSSTVSTLTSPPAFVFTPRAASNSDRLFCSARHDTTRQHNTTRPDSTGPHASA